MSEKMSEMSATNGKECEHNAGFRWEDLAQSGQFVIQKNGLLDLRLVRRVRSKVAMDAVRGDEVLAEGDDFAALSELFRL